MRLGYDGGFFDRTLSSLDRSPVTLGVAFAQGFLPLLRASLQDRPLDVMLTEDGLMWHRA